MSVTDRVEERRGINIGNDVFVGMNVSVLDGVNIKDGAIGGAGAVVVDDVPPFAIVGGVPARLIRYRFEPNVRQALPEIKWWDFPESRLPEVEAHFWDVNRVIERCIREKWS